MISGREVHEPDSPAHGRGCDLFFGQEQAPMKWGLVQRVAWKLDREVRPGDDVPTVTSAGAA